MQSLALAGLGRFRAASTPEPREATEMTRSAGLPAQSRSASVSNLSQADSDAAISEPSGDEASDEEALVAEAVPAHPTNVASLARLEAMLRSVYPGPLEHAARCLCETLAATGICSGVGVAAFELALGLVTGFSANAPYDLAAWGGLALGGGVGLLSALCHAGR